MTEEALNSPDGGGFTAMHWACYLADSDLIRALQERKVDETIRISQEGLFYNKTPFELLPSHIDLDSEFLCSSSSSSSSNSSSSATEEQKTEDPVYSPRRSSP